MRNRQLSSSNKVASTSKKFPYWIISTKVCIKHANSKTLNTNIVINLLLMETLKAGDFPNLLLTWTPPTFIRTWFIHIILYYFPQQHFAKNDLQLLHLRYGIERKKEKEMKYCLRTRYPWVLQVLTSMMGQIFLSKIVLFYRKSWLA